MAESFRPYPAKGEEAKGSFNPITFLYESITKGPFHFAGLVPHFVMIFYAAYRLGVAYGYVPTNSAAVALGLIPLLQGLSAGAFVGCLVLRYGPLGQFLQTKDNEGTATDSELRRIRGADIGIAAAGYVVLATTLWQHLPDADTPGVAALKKTAERLGLSGSS
ncbi:hypothetical protein CBOM_06886 [Ceraceosorus bombacis]|uniref:Uncharacterized protein n=1 Tax=Ceraceosorus bombacis TaxID=401625 RepID=A0A0P1BRR7_9BASI|nr:hypothetical protein CBOM_06886 [Ceraceosorus bombacis]